MAGPALKSSLLSTHVPSSSRGDLARSRQPTDALVFWPDGLDIPIVQLFDASLAEGLCADERTVTQPAGDSHARLWQD
jgi:gentisate 1,2-dioxygenase